MYIGMVYQQNVSVRLRAPDHQERQRSLQEMHPSAVVHISLGTPEFLIGNLNEKNVRTVEHLLIYSNWHEDMLNQRAVVNFNAPFQVLVENCGFNYHLVVKSAYGVFYTEER